MPIHFCLDWGLGCELQPHFLLCKRREHWWWDGMGGHQSPSLVAYVSMDPRNQGDPSNLEMTKQNRSFQGKSSQEVPRQLKLAWVPLEIPSGSLQLLKTTNTWVLPGFYTCSRKQTNKQKNKETLLLYVWEIHTVNILGVLLFKRAFFVIDWLI